MQICHWFTSNENTRAELLDWHCVANDIATTKRMTTIHSVLYPLSLTIDNSTMNITQNGSYTSDWYGMNATIRPFLAFFVIAGLIGNGLVLILFYRLKRLKTWDNAFTINLAVGDLMSSVAAIALAFSPEFHIARIISCHSLSVMQCCRLANFLVLQEIALLRYWRVHRPGRIINKSVFVTGLVIPWIVGIAYRFIVISQVKDYESVSHCVEYSLQLEYTNSWFRLKMTPLVIVVGTVVMTTCYMKIMIYYRRQCRVHVQTIAALQTGTATESTSGWHFVQRMHEFYRNQIDEDKRVVINSLLVVGAFYMTCIPLTVLIMCCRNGIIRNTSPVIDYIALLMTFSCAVNPALYSMRSKYFRQGLKRIFHTRPNTVSTVMPPEI